MVDGDFREFWWQISKVSVSVFFRLRWLSEGCAHKHAINWLLLIIWNYMWLIVILSWFFILYLKIAAIIKINFTHPMLIAHFFPFLLCPVELNRPLHRIIYITSPLDSPFTIIYRRLHVTYIHMEGLGYHKGHHWSSTEVAPTLNDLPLEWVWNNTLFNGKTCWPVHRWSMTPVGLRFKTRVTSLSTPNGRPVRAWRLWRASGKPCKRRALATWEAGSWRTKRGKISSDFRGTFETT